MRIYTLNANYCTKWILLSTQFAVPNKNFVRFHKILLPKDADNLSFLSKFCSPMLNFFWHTLMLRIQNLGLFKGFRSRKEKMTTPPSFLGQKIKQGVFSKEFLLFNEVLKNYIFFKLPIKKIGFITLILSKFQIRNANSWSICSKRFELIVYTFICVFWDIKFFWLLSPSKSSRGP